MESGDTRLGVMSRSLRDASGYRDRLSSGPSRNAPKETGAMKPNTPQAQTAPVPEIDLTGPERTWLAHRYEPKDCSTRTSGDIAEQGSRIDGYQPEGIQYSAELALHSSAFRTDEVRYSAPEGRRSDAKSQTTRGARLQRDGRSGKLTVPVQSTPFPPRIRFGGQSIRFGEAM